MKKEFSILYDRYNAGNELRDAMGSSSIIGFAQCKNVHFDSGSNFGKINEKIVQRISLHNKQTESDCFFIQPVILDEGVDSFLMLTVSRSFFLNQARTCSQNEKSIYWQLNSLFMFIYVRMYACMDCWDAYMSVCVNISPIKSNSNFTSIDSLIRFSQQMRRHQNTIFARSQIVRSR